MNGVSVSPAGSAQSWIHWRGPGTCEPRVPRGPREAGGGVQAETTPGSNFLSWPEGAGGEEGHGEREGLEEALLTPAEGFGEIAGAPATGANRCSLPSYGPGAGLGPWRRSEAALSAPEVSALT